MTRYIANILTFCRILGSIALLLFPVFSPAFYILYLFCGFSDMADGTIARKTNSVSKFGSRLDTVADLIFVAGAAMKLLPALPIPGWLWIWVSAIAMMKVANIIGGYIFRKEFTALHTVMNKATGLVLFLFPFTLFFIDLRYTAPALCALATFSAIQEGGYVFTDRDQTRFPFIK